MLIFPSCFSLMSFPFLPFPLQQDLEQKHVEIITAFNELYFVITHDQDLPIAERIALRNLIVSTNESITFLFNVRYFYFADLNDFPLKVLCLFGSVP